MNRSDSRRGMVLVAVLWSIALLAALAMAASVTFRSFAGVVAVDRSRLQSDALLTAGLEAAAGVIQTSGRTPLRDLDTMIVLATGTVRARINDEGGRIDIGKAPVEVLTALLRSVGAPPAAADGVASAIVASRGPVAAGRIHAAEQTFFDTRQLARIQGMRAQWLAGLAPLTTVYGSETINPLTAPRGVIAALPGVDGVMLEGFLAERRDSFDPVRLIQILVPAQRYLAVKPQRVAAVELMATLTEGHVVVARAVIAVLPQDSEPYRVLSFTPVRTGLD